MSSFVLVNNGLLHHSYYLSNYDNITFLSLYYLLLNMNEDSDMLYRSLLEKYCCKRIINHFEYFFGLL